MSRFAILLLAGCGFRGRGEPIDVDAPRVVDQATPDAAPTPFTMTGARWKLPCLDNNDPNANACHCAGGVITDTVELAGTGERFHVRARIRGVVETMNYAGGSTMNAWQTGGAPVGGNNWYAMTVSAPLAIYYINAGSGNQNYSTAFDYEATFDVDDDATITFSWSGSDSIQWEGVDMTGADISMAGVTDPPQPYNGQWARLDVLSATRD